MADTHCAQPGTVLTDGVHETVCGQRVSPAAIEDTDRTGIAPTCWGCHAWLIGQAPEPDEEQPRRRLTRAERLQRLADAGCDTWQEYRGER